MCLDGTGVTHFFPAFSNSCTLSAHTSILVPFVLSAPPSITSLTFDPDSITSALTCTSTGSPATTVTWMKDGSQLVIDGTTYSMKQTVTGRNTSTYDNVLTIVDSGNSFGTYICEVSNALGSSGATSIAGKYVYVRLVFMTVGFSSISESRHIFRLLLPLLLAHAKHCM